MIIKATFIGNSTSYETGKEYKLLVPDFKGMSVRQLDGKGFTPYQSLSAFLKNWTNIKFI